MKRLVLLLLLLSFASLAACQSAVVDPTLEPTDLPESQEETPGSTTPPQATAVPDSYPGQLRATPLPEGYPAQQPALPEAAYPADQMIWITRPLGSQCQPEENYDYASVGEAVEALEATGVEVEASETVDLTVCEACDVCPTSAHFRLQITREDLSAAQMLGWQQEQQQ